MNTVRSFIRTHQRTLAVCFALLLCAGLLLSGGRAEAASVLRLPAGLKTIQAEAFYGDSSLDEVILPDGLERIESRAFAGSGVLTVRIPASVTYIAPDAFDGIECLNVEVEEGTWAAEWWASVRGNFISKPEIVTQPVPQEVPNGETVTFTVAAENADSIRWQVDRGDDKGFVDLKENTNWHNVKTDTLTFTAIPAREVYIYRAVAANRAGETPSDPVQFTILYPPEIVTQPVPQEVPNGETVTFTVTAKNADSIRWQVDRGDEKGFVDLKESSVWHNVNTDTLTFTAITAREVYTYRAVASNRAGETPSEPVQFAILYPPEIVTQPVPQEVPNGETVTFTVAAKNADSIRWQVDRGDEKGFVDLKENSVWHNVNTDTLTFTAIAAREAYTYRAVAANRAGETLSDPVQFTIIYPPVIVTQPVHQYVPNEETVSFTVATENADSVRWQVDRGDDKGFVDLKENSVWHNVNTDTLTFKAIPAREVFTYRAVAANRAGETPSDPVQFTITPLPKIVTQPENQQVLAGEMVRFTVEAENADEYIWQMDTGSGNGFVNIPNSSSWQGVRTNTLGFQPTSARLQYRFRVLISNRAGTVMSDIVQFTIIPKPRPVFVVQPVHQDVLAGQMVVFAVETMYADTIRWQVDRGDGKGFFDLPENSVWQGTQTNSLTFKAVLAREPYTFRAVATNEVGDTISDPVQFTVIYPPEIVTQPANQEVASGNTVTFTVAAKNADSIRWQADKGDGAGFVDLPDQSPWNGVGTDTLSFKAVSSAAGYLFRAVASNAAGETPSEPAQYTIVPMPKIVTQPVHQYVPNGEMVSFTVKTKYASAVQWQVDRGDGKGFVDLTETSAWQNTKTETLTFKAIEAREKYKFQAVVSNIAGTVVSSTVQFTIMPLPSFTRQPADQEALLKETVAFTVETENADSIQWQVDRQDGKGFVNLSDNSAWQGTQIDTLTFKAIDDREPYTFRAVAKNKAGEKNSEEVRFTIIRPPVIVTQPVHQDVADGETVTFTVAAENADSIRWQVDRGDGKDFVDLKESTVWQNVNTDTLTFTASAARELYIFRAVAKNRAGETPSEPVQFTIVPLPKIVTQPADQVAGLGETVTFTVETENADSIRWKVDRQDGKGFVNLNENDTWHGVTTDALSFSAHKGRLPYRFRAVAKNDIGETESDVVRFRLPLPAPVIRLLEAIDNTVILEWDGVDDAESYNLYYGTTEACDTLYDTFDGSADSVTIWQNLAYGTTYYFRLSAVTEGAESEKSDAESVAIGPEMFEFLVITNPDEEDPSWDRGAFLNKYIGDPHYSGNIVIPSLHDGAPVWGISDRSFKDCSGLTGELIIPDSVMSIGDYAFYGCSSLTGSLTIPDSVTSIGEYAFEDCSSFTGSLIIPDSVTSIGDSAFSGCSGFNGSLSISKNLTSIEETVFYNCSGLTGSLIIPDGVISVGYCAFSGCSGFDGVLKIPNTVSTIDDGAFQSCRNLTGSLIIPDSVTDIGLNAFAGCSGFNGSLTISNSVISIGEDAFGACSGLTGSLTIPDSVTSIGKSAFYRCGGFDGILTIPVSVTNIGNEAFYECEGWTDIIYAGSREEWEEINIGSGNDVLDRVRMMDEEDPEEELTETIENQIVLRENKNGTVTVIGYLGDSSSLIIPAATSDGKPITAIGDNAFRNNKTVESVTLPDGLLTISSAAFKNTALRRINLPSSLISIADNAFDGTVKPVAETTEGTYAESWWNSHKSRYGYHAITGVTLNQYSVTLKYGQNFMLKAEPVPADANIANISWSLSGRTENRNMYCNKAECIIPGWYDGIATVVMEDEDGNQQSASCSITVTDQGIEYNYIKCIDCSTPYPARGMRLTYDLYLTDTTGIDYIEKSIGNLCQKVYLDEFPTECVFASKTAKSGEIEFYICYKEGYYVNGKKRQKIENVDPLTRIVYDELPGYDQLAVCTQLSPTKWSITLDACELFHWSVVSEADWLTLSQTNGTGGGTITVTADTADLSSSRTGILKFYSSYRFGNSNNLIQTLEIFQSSNKDMSGTVTLASGAPVQDIEVYVLDQENHWAGSTFTDQNGHWYVSGLTPGENYKVVYHSDRYTVSGSGDTYAAGGRVSATASLIGETDSGIQFWMKQNRVEISSAKVGTYIDFEVTAPGASAVRLVVDGKVYETYPVIEGTASFSRLFASVGTVVSRNSGQRIVQIQAFTDENGWANISEGKTLTLTKKDDLKKPQITGALQSIIKAPVRVSWENVKYARYYSVYVFGPDGTRLYPDWRNEETEKENGALTRVIPGDVFAYSGTYSIQVVTTGVEYNSSTGVHTIDVFDTDVGVEISLPDYMNGRTIGIGDLIDIEVKSIFGDDALADNQPIITSNKPDNTVIDGNTVIFKEPGAYLLTASFVYEEETYSSNVLSVKVAKPRILEAYADLQHNWSAIGGDVPFRVSCNFTPDSVNLILEDAIVDLIDNINGDEPHRKSFELWYTLPNDERPNYYQIMVKYNNVEYYSDLITVYSVNPDTPFTGKYCYAKKETILYAEPGGREICTIPEKGNVFLYSVTYNGYHWARYMNEDGFVWFDDLELLPNDAVPVLSSDSEDVILIQSGKTAALDYTVQAFPDTKDVYITIHYIPEGYVGDNYAASHAVKLVDRQSCERYGEGSSFFTYHTTATEPGVYYAYVQAVDHLKNTSPASVSVETVIVRVYNFSQNLYITKLQERDLLKTPMNLQPAIAIQWDEPLRVIGAFNKWYLAEKNGINGFILKEHVSGIMNQPEKHAYLIDTKGLQESLPGLAFFVAAPNYHEQFGAMLHNCGYTVEDHEHVDQQSLLELIGMIADNSDFNDYTVVAILTHGGREGYGVDSMKISDHYLSYNTLAGALREIRGHLTFFNLTCESAYFMDVLEDYNTDRWTDFDKFICIFPSSRDEFAMVENGKYIFVTKFCELISPMQGQGLTLAELKTIIPDGTRWPTGAAGFFSGMNKEQTVHYWGTDNDAYVFAP